MADELLENDLEFEAAVGLSHLSDKALREYSLHAERLKAQEYVLPEEYRENDRLWRIYLQAADESLEAFRRCSNG